MIVITPFIMFKFKVKNPNITNVIENINTIKSINLYIIKLLF